jgi:ABC-type nitrate/sulfonate/bicarbonate transport system ATPase subunit
LRCSRQIQSSRAICFVRLTRQSFRCLSLHAVGLAWHAASRSHAPSPGVRAPPTAALLVTHDCSEAAALAHRIVVRGDRPARSKAEITGPCPHQDKNLVP